MSGSLDSAKKALKRKLIDWSPGLMIRYQWLRGIPEDEVELLKYLCDPEARSIDVGASDGRYTLWALPYSKAVYAFECRPEGADELRYLFGDHRNRVLIEEVALSNRAGVATLSHPPGDEGLATIDSGNPVSSKEGQTHIDVRTMRLDDYNLEKVAFIKIDVEGHETAVVEGAMGTIKRDMPNLIIEMEERHSPGCPEKLTRGLASVGYKGFFLIDGELVAMEKFRLSDHQPISNISGDTRLGTYINNFIFVRDASILPDRPL